MTEAKIGDDLPIAFDVGSLEVVEEATAATNHFQQPLAAVVILRVRPEVTGQVIDVVGENCHLNLCRAGIGLVRAVFFDCRGLLKCHVVAVISARGARWVSLNLRKP